MFIDFATKYSNVVADKDLGESIYIDIKILLGQNNDLTIDLKNLDVMTSFCAKQIFGSIYLELGPEVFFKKIKFINTSSDLKIIISESIQSAVTEN